MYKGVVKIFKVWYTCWYNGKNVGNWVGGKGAGDVGDRGGCLNNN